MRELIKNIDKIHTTPMGAERIKRNLGLQTDDVATWCKNAIRNADIIIGQGKNWYVYVYMKNQLMLLIGNLKWS